MTRRAMEDLSFNYYQTFPDTDSLKIAELNAPIFTEIDHTIRVKVTDTCGLACTFCHNEGTPVAIRKGTQGFRVSLYEDSNGVDFTPGDMRPNDAFRQAMSKIIDVVPTTELHWTGGEPTLNRRIVDLTRVASEELNLDVKMTSNGEKGANGIRELAQAGLGGINFSVFGTTPEELAAVQPMAIGNLDWAERKLNMLLEAMAAAREQGLRTTANLVVRNEGDIERVNRIMDNTNPDVQIRIQADLDSQADGWDAIYKMLWNLKASPVKASFTAGTSDAKVLYRLEGGREVVFKRFLSERLPVTCLGCEFNNDKDCTEGYYGLRLYATDTGEYKIGVCIRRMDLAMGVDEFANGPVPKEVIDFRIAHMEEIRSSSPQRLIARLGSSALGFPG